MNLKALFSTGVFIFIQSVVFAQLTNKPELEENFMDMGFGIFIHWSMAFNSKKKQIESVRRKLQKPFPV